MNFQSRRAFLATLGGAGAAMVLHPLSGWAVDQDDAKIAAIVAATIGIDAHNHIDVPLTSGVPGTPIDLSEQLKKSGLSAICMTFAVDYQKLINPGDAYQRFLNGLKAMDHQLEINGMKRALNLTDIRTAHDRRLPIVIQSVEGGHFLEGHLDRLHAAYKRGLRHLGLLHDNDDAVPLGDVATNPAKYGGLTAFGKDVIKECNRLGILIDLAHCSAEAVASALEISKSPVIVSHTGLDTQLGQNPVMAKMMQPRLISKELAKIIAGAGGVIGVWTHLSDTPLEYAANVRALVDIVGIDHVCIGTDTKLTEPYRPAGTGPKPSDSTKPQPGPGGNPQRIGERTNAAWKDQKVGFYFAVVGAMLETGFNQQEIAKFGGDNFSRVFDAATTVY